MKLANIKEMLKTLNIPIAYNHFSKRTEPPYGTYSVISTINLFADNRVFSKKQEIQVELYTYKKDVELQERLETLLNDNETPYEVESEIFIEEENVYQIIYKIMI